VSPKSCPTNAPDRLDGGRRKLVPLLGRLRFQQRPPNIAHKQNFAGQINKDRYHSKIIVPVIVAANKVATIVDAINIATGSIFNITRRRGLATPTTHLESALARLA
jgi:hypothetical protein